MSGRKAAPSSPWAATMIEHLESGAYQETRLPLPESGSLAECTLVCLALNGSVRAADIGCRANTLRFLSAMAWLFASGYPVRSIPGASPRWCWSMVEWGSDWVDLVLTTNGKSFPLGPLRQWAMRVGA